MLKKLSRRYLIISNIFILGVILLFSFYQNFRFTELFSTDLRNRVVGARLVQEGKIPYFYKWAKGDGSRYFDPQNIDDRVVSSMTATPVFHHLLSPICNLSQHTISVVWFILTYIALLMIIGLGVACCISLSNKMVVLNIGAIFSVTDAFKIHLLYGQYYIFIAIIAMAVYFLIFKNRSLPNIIAGILAVFLLLIRPLATVFLIPFLFFLKTNSRFFLRTIAVCIFLYGGFCIINKNEVRQWMDFSYAVKGHSQIVSHPVQLNDRPEKLVQIEGYNLDSNNAELEKRPIVLSFETLNIYLIYQKLTGKTIPVRALTFAWACCMLALCFAYFKMHRQNYDLSIMFIFGYLLYMASEVFMPVPRNIYCAVQFFSPVLIYLSVCRSFYSRSALLIFSGLFLNITDFTFLPMRHSVGEILIFCGFLFFVFKERKEHFFKP